MRRVEVCARTAFAERTSTVVQFHLSQIKSAYQALQHRLKSDEEGAALIEYSILIGLIAAAVIVAIGAISIWIQGKWTALQGALGA